MFGKNEINLPVYSDKLDFGFEKNLTFKWDELTEQGVVKETIQEDDDTTVLTKEFISFDGSLMKKETIKLSKSQFDNYKLTHLTKEEANKEYMLVNTALNRAIKGEEFEHSAILRDKIKLLKEILLK